MVSGIIASAWLLEKNSVLPSGAAAFSALAAICPPAPGRFSTTTLRLSASDMACARWRAMASVPPPAGKPTRMRSG